MRLFRAFRQAPKVYPVELYPPPNTMEPAAKRAKQSADTASGAGSAHRYPGARDPAFRRVLVTGANGKVRPAIKSAATQLEVCARGTT